MNLKDERRSRNFKDVTNTRHSGRSKGVYEGLASRKREPTLKEKVRNTLREWKADPQAVEKHRKAANELHNRTWKKR